MEASENTNKKGLSELLRHFPRGHLMATGGLILSLALLTAFSSSESAQQRTTHSLSLDLAATNEALNPAGPIPLSGPLPDPGTGETPTTTAPEPSLNRKQFTVRSGDSLSRLFKRAGLTDRDLYELMDQAPEASALRRIMPGHEVTFGVDDQGQLQELLYQRDRLRSLRFARGSEGFRTEQLERKPDVQVAYRRATIDSSLFMAGQRAGMSDNLTMKLAGIFGWDIDFILDIRRGDSFSVLFEEHFLDGEKIGNGAILAAEFTNRGETYRAVRYVDANGDANYFTPNGRSMRRAFLRTPVEFTRISSPFNPNRRHPVLNTIRAHEGTDYAAPHGTPVKASGDGKIRFAGRKGGYGKTIIVQHGQTYRTLYAHLRGFRRGIGHGSRVKQGQTIGYVGSSGLATGPHLHYEFHVNGAVRDPQTVELPQADSIPETEMARFETQVQPILAQMEQYRSETQLASLGEAVNVN